MSPLCLFSFEAWDEKLNTLFLLLFLFVGRLVFLLQRHDSSSDLLVPRSSASPARHQGCLKAFGAPEMFPVTTELCWTASFLNNIYQQAVTLENSGVGGARERERERERGRGRIYFYTLSRRYLGLFSAAELNKRSHKSTVHTTSNKCVTNLRKPP